MLRKVNKVGEKVNLCLRIEGAIFLSCLIMDDWHLVV